MIESPGSEILDCLVDGEWSGYLSVADRGFMLGEGIWERVAMVHGRPWWWQDHIDRLNRGGDRLALKVPHQSILLREAQTVAAGHARALVYIFLTRGGALERQHGDGRPGETRIVMAFPWPPSDPQLNRRGVDARFCSLKLGVQPALGGINHLNRLEWVLAARENAAYEQVEGLLKDTNGHLISALASNIFLVMGRQLLTPRMDRNGIRGVLRGRIIREFKSRTELRRISPDMLEEADEVFLSDLVRGIVPVRSIEELSFEIGPVTRELQSWLSNRQEQL